MSRGNVASTSKKNQEKAPECAKFVEDMRAVFGSENVIVLYVEEGEVKLGEKQ